MVKKARNTCENANGEILDHFVGVNKTIIPLLSPPPAPSHSANHLVTPIQPPIPPITTNFFESTTEHITRQCIERIITMSLDFCTKVTRKLAKIGYPKKAARRFAKTCFVLMTLTCGLFGLFENGKAPLYLIAGAGAVPSGARAGILSPASLLIRR